jgi:sialic acid synthase SpsE
MHTVQLLVNETDFQMYKLGSGQIRFADLVESIRREYARASLRECHAIAAEVGLSSMTLDEINAEINAVRNAKTHS